MKLKQIKTAIFAFLIVASSATGVVVTGFGMSTTSQTASAYVCPGQLDNPPTYEYHDDGKCWKLNYKDANVAKSYPKVIDGVNKCENGSGIVQINGGDECKVTCSGSDPYHADTNSCFHYTQGEYISDDTQKVTPTNNDGTAINDPTCTDNFTYVKDTGGHGAAGCYSLVNGKVVCGANQTQSTSYGEFTDSTSCDDTGKDHLVPKDPRNDSTDCVGSDKLPLAVKSGSTCKQFSDFSKDATTCDGVNGVFEPKNGNTNDYECRKPDAAEVKCQNTYGGSYDQRKAKRDACYAGTEAGSDCTKEATQDEKDACAEGQKAAADAAKGASAFDTKTCDDQKQIKTNIISGSECSGTGITVIGNILKLIINILTLLVGIAAVGGITWEALQYAQAQDDSSTVTNARNRIRDIVIGVVVYGLMIAIINWLVPGGVVGS